MWDNLLPIASLPTLVGSGGEGFITVAHTSAPYGWTVIRRDSASCGFFTYKRDCPADAAHYAADLAPFTFPTRAEAIAQGKLGNFAYASKVG
jgi:hypothetical protein